MIEFYLVVAMVFVILGWVSGIFDIGIRRMGWFDWLFPILVAAVWPIAAIVTFLVLIEEILEF